MEGNTCDINHLDSDVLLPPRKRLLAVLKKQTFDINPCTPSSPTDDITGFEFDIRLNDLLKFHSVDCNCSIEEIVEASRVAALKAVELAKAARAVAEEKAAKAAEAMAAAKSAMELVATVSGEVMDKDKYSKKNKMKKHIPVQMLYNNKYKVTKDCRTDEDLARTLSRTINSSPRISKNATSDSKNCKHKRLKSSFPSENAKIQNGSALWEGNRPFASNGIDKALNGSSQEKELIRVDLNIAKFNKADLRKMENGKGKPMNSKEEFGESPDDICNVDKKKGRMKQKKLPLSNCSFRDKVNPKKDMNSKSSSSPDEKISKVTGINEPVFPVERSSTLKCQTFKASTCVKK
ncbi:uncharacterized protein LOC129896634 [Solanum dulcamara]|uniref:uncharacterized protein LOC129896634 n=1 Tax=Solanum dulcamara TaxID=45834 RepID=UPI002486C2A1|nr:uncharacterized protein LOC129896634 [Solanum dulcamara]XP_055828542.1 uncharacterized protein LOC129896634 [Solanum dulcamara]